MSLASATLAQRGLRGGTLLLGANALQLLVAIGSTMLLARLLTPADFGLFAMAMVAFALVAPIRDFGLPETLVQSPVLHPFALRRLGHLNLAGTLMLGLVTLGLGSALARFYAEPRVTGLSAWLAMALVLRGLANLRFGLLQRDMAWGTIAATNLLSYVAGTTVACALALQGAGAFALVAQQFVWFAGQAILLGVLGRRFVTSGQPRIEMSPDPVGSVDDGRVRHHLVFARSVSGTRLLAEGVAQLDRLVVGRVADVATLGLYQNALRWASLPMLQLLLPAKAIATSSLARLAHDPVRLRGAVRDVYMVVGSLLLPMLVFLALSADEVIPLLLGDQWTGAVLLFQLLALAVLFEAMDRMAHWLHLGCGHVQARLHWVLAVSPVLAAAIVLGGVTGGAVGVAAALLGTRALLAAPSLAWATRGTVLSPRDVLLPWRRPVAAASIATAAWWGLRYAIFRPAVDSAAGAGETAVQEIATNAMQLLSGAAVFGTVYALAWIALPGGRKVARRVLAAQRGE